MIIEAQGLSGLEQNKWYVVKKGSPNDKAFDTKESGLISIDALPNAKNYEVKKLVDKELIESRNSSSNNSDIKESKMAKKLTKMEAFRIVRSLKESKTPIRFYKKEDSEEGAVYAVVTPDGGEMSVTFDPSNGDLLIGPFSSEDAAKAAVGDDVVTVAGVEGGGDVEPMEPAAEEDEVLANLDQNKSDIGDTMTETQKKIRSNMLRLRKNVVESISKRVKADILRESELLDIDTDIKDGTAATDLAAGALDSGKVASFVNDADTGSTDTSADATQDPAAKNIDANILEGALTKGQLVNVYDRKTGAKVDTGMVESIKSNKVKLGESDEYSASDYRFHVLAS